MEKLELTVNPRQVLGKEVKTLRRQGITPVHLFGHDMEALALQAESALLEKLVVRAGTSHVVSLAVGGEAKPHNVLVREVQRDPITGKLFHVDFYALTATEKIKLEMPIRFVGEAAAIKNKKGLLLENIRFLEIECLPADIPASIEVDVSALAQPGDSIHVEDLKPIKGVTVLRNPKDVIAKVEEIKVEVEAKPAAAEVKAEAAPEEAEAAEGKKEEKEAK
ncbi:MAG: 50S ribosomal protein L25 [Chloroflexi bacterium]|nr:50S ribosomal protein L25 [Chloroflexota bacterium]